ncbi:MAG: triose-phosphate isomerase [candidate division WOR-3 bacterium]|nr:triose-phosphate isomerase [candidate division WOR-3 bacterium]MDW8113522.1 triose-phosphate isomerase [candidate division WOR-3 bacterium]
MKKRKVFIGGNWKMNFNHIEGKEFVERLIHSMREDEKKEIVIFPPFTTLFSVAETIKNTKIKLGAQNVHWEDKGAFTGEISPQFLIALGCEYVIIGHSERRKYFFEDDEIINKKIKKVLNTNLTPVFCVGENLEERKEKKTLTIIENQLKKGLKDIKELNGMVIAYEPVWAIGTGINATPSEAREVHRFIRHFISENYGKEISENLRIIYGGSVNKDNIKELLEEEEIDGVLVGGASIKLEEFVYIVNLDL